MNKLQYDGNTIYIRDAIACSLSNLGAQEAVPVFIDLIKNPENIKNIAPLILYLSDLDCKEYYTYFVGLICRSDFHIRCMCQIILEKYSEKVSKELRGESLRILRNNISIVNSQAPGFYIKPIDVELINQMQFISYGMILLS